jgi:hypothetical protein
MSQRRWPALSRLVAALTGLAFGIMGAELTFGSLRPEEPGTDAVLYSIEVRNGAGDLLASPMLVGEEGRPVHLSLLSGPHSESMEMSLDLDPQRDGADRLCLGYRLSIDDGLAHSGRMSVSYGQRRSVNLRRAGEFLRLSLVVARAHTQDFERLLQRLRRPAA